jgi:nucleoid DNA-binding protein
MISKKDCARSRRCVPDAVKHALKEQHNIEAAVSVPSRSASAEDGTWRATRAGELVEVAARPVPVFKPARSCGPW